MKVLLKTERICCWLLYRILSPVVSMGRAWTDRLHRIDRARMAMAPREPTVSDIRPQGYIKVTAMDAQGRWQELHWDKGHVGLGRIWRNQHELIIAARWNDSPFYDDGELRADVLRHNATTSRNRLHPVEKPPSLLADLIRPITAKADTILDPFMGSGTTLVAAKQLGRKAIGIEIEKKYCDIAIERLRQEVLPLNQPEAQPEEQGELEELR